MNVLPFDIYTARRLRKHGTSDDVEFTLDERSIGIMDDVYVDAGDGWCLAFVAFYWPGDDDPALSGSTDLMVRFYHEAPRKLWKVETSWRIAWPVETVGADGVHRYTCPAFAAEVRS